MFLKKISFYFAIVVLFFAISFMAVCETEEIGCPEWSVPEAEKDLDEFVGLGDIVAGLRNELETADALDENTVSNLISTLHVYKNEAEFNQESAKSELSASADGTNQECLKWQENEAESDVSTFSRLIGVANSLTEEGKSTEELSSVLDSLSASIVKQQEMLKNQLPGKSVNN